MKVYPEVQMHSVFLTTIMVSKVLSNKPPMRSILMRAEDYVKGNEDNLNMAPVNTLYTINRYMAPVNTLPKEAARIFGAFIRVNTFTSLLLKE